MWTYHSATGALDHDGQPIGECYSGHVQGLNNQDLEYIRALGPIPRGRYIIGPFVDDPERGPLAAHLRPDPANRMYGRDGFMIHGDNPQLNHTASHGCIIAAHVIRQAIADSQDWRLEVV